jgi:hypothetical protein
MLDVHRSTINHDCSAFAKTKNDANAISGNGASAPFRELKAPTAPTTAPHTT